MSLSLCWVYDQYRAAGFCLSYFPWWFARSSLHRCPQMCLDLLEVTALMLSASAVALVVRVADTLSLISGSVSGIKKRAIVAFSSSNFNAFSAVLILYSSTNRVSCSNSDSFADILSSIFDSCAVFRMDNVWSATSCVPLTLADGFSWSEFTPASSVLNRFRRPLFTWLLFPDLVLLYVRLSSDWICSDTNFYCPKPAPPESIKPWCINCEDTPKVLLIGAQDQYLNLDQ